MRRAVLAAPLCACDTSPDMYVAARAIGAFLLCVLCACGDTPPPPPGEIRQFAISQVHIPHSFTEMKDYGLDLNGWASPSRCGWRLAEPRGVAPVLRLRLRDRAGDV